MNRGVEIVRLGEVRPAPTPEASPPPEPLADQPPWGAYRVPGKPGAELFPKARLRRLGRAQAMALCAVKLSLQGGARTIPAQGDEVAVCVGTAWAELGVELAFLENMIRRGEKGARPTKFANSVHNALASQVAMEFNFTGENHSFTHDTLSFEDALWQGRNLLSWGRARRVVVCGVDALTDFMLMRGHLLDELRSCPAPLRPLQELEPQTGTLPGEGAAALVLAPAGESPHALARLDAVVARGPANPQQIVIADEVAFIEEVARLAGLRPAGFHLLVGANGDFQDARYAEVSRRLAPAGGVGVYRHLTGDFATASALGMTLATRMVATGELPDEVRLVEGSAPVGPLPVLLYHLSRSGTHSAVLLSPV